MLDHPLESADAYVSFLSGQELPVLRQTVRALEALRDQQETLNGRQLASIVMGDPLMTLKLLAHLQRHRRQSQNHDITTIDRAIMMMGIGPFIQAFLDMPTLETHLQDHPRALIGVVQVIGRARRTARYARDWAIARHDMDVDEITVAALLREATEIACWTTAPTLSLRVAAMQAMDPRLRSAVAQKIVFGTTWNEIQLGLIQAWRMPELLTVLLDDANANNPRVRNVTLAADFVRHLAHGWTDPALPDDIEAIEKLLRIRREPLLRRLGVPEEEMQRFSRSEEG